MLSLTFETVEQESKKKTFHKNVRLYGDEKLELLRILKIIALNTAAQSLFFEKKNTLHSLRYKKK